MRVVLSIFLSLGIAIFFAVAAQANDLQGKQAKLLTASALNPASQKYMEKLCAHQGYLTMPTKRVCDRVVSESPLSQVSFDYCMDKTKSRGNRVSSALECFEQTAGADYPLEYIKTCEKVTPINFGGNETSSMRICLKYLAGTSSSFDSEAFALCFKATERDFEEAKPCLNSIRDRKIDAQKLERECFDNGKPNRETLSCIDKISDSAPMATECAAPRAAANPITGHR